MLGDCDPIWHLDWPPFYTKSSTLWSKQVLTLKQTFSYCVSYVLIDVSNNLNPPFFFRAHLSGHGADGGDVLAERRAKRPVPSKKNENENKNERIRTRKRKRKMIRIRIRKRRRSTRGREKKTQQRNNFFLQHSSGASLV